MIDVTTERLILLENGYLPVPVAGKQPVGEGWENPANITASVISSWPAMHPRAASSGILTKYTPAVDIDIRHPEAAAAAEELLRVLLDGRGTIICRIGQAPKRALLLRTAIPFRKIVKELTAPGDDVDAPGYKPQRIEILGDGQQIVVRGIHPDTRREYACAGGISPLNTVRTDLVEVTEAEIRDAVDQVVAMLIDEHGFQIYERPTTNGANGTERGPRVDVDKELADAGRGQLNDVHIRVIPSLLQQNWHPDEVLERLLGHAEGLGLERAAESKTIGGRILSALNNLLVPGWDPAASPIPSWLCGDFHQDWMRVTDAGHSPRFGRNPSGFFLRGLSPKGAKEEALKEEVPPETQAPPAKPKSKGRIPVLLSSAAFVAGFVPPDYLLDGVLQRRFLYSFTGMTGHGKTAVILLLAACVDTGSVFAGHRCAQGSVLILAGENPDDVRMRWIGLAEERGFDPNKSNVHFVAGVYPIALIREIVAREAAAAKTEFSLVIVDTSAAYFPGEEENSNVQLGNHARNMRECLIGLPGGPTVVVTTHPVKNAAEDNLLPRGGGAFIAEVDGNLTCWLAGDIATVHWAGKYRGPDFGEMVFELQETFAPALQDSEGRPMPTVTAHAISDQAHTEIRVKAREEDDVIMRLLAGDEDLSTAAMAERAGWLDKTGEPNRLRAWRSVRRLVSVKLVKKDRALGGRWALTEAGRAAIGLPKRGKSRGNSE